MTGETMADRSAEQQLAVLGLSLPVLPDPANCYVEAVLDGTSLYLSGKGPRRANGTRRSGKVGGDISVEEAQEDARLTGLNLLAAIRKALGSLDRVERVVKVFAMVNAVPDFGRHPEVVDAFSQLMIDVFGERGRHARSAIGVGSLPNNMTVEIEMIVRVSE